MIISPVYDNTVSLVPLPIPYLHFLPLCDFTGLATIQQVHEGLHDLRVPFLLVRIERVVVALDGTAVLLLQVLIVLVVSIYIYYICMFIFTIPLCTMCVAGDCRTIRDACAATLVRGTWRSSRRSSRGLRAAVASWAGAVRCLCRARRSS
ncbi:hypothetical protein EON64_15565 [archaeon]|nr:MAG: hypothetical protein EON64_15565 [archaeon]